MIILPKSSPDSAIAFFDDNIIRDWFHPFKKLGIKVNLEVLEWGAIEKRRKDGNWDMVLFATNCAMLPDPYYYLQRSYGTGGSYNYVNIPIRP